MKKVIFINNEYYHVFNRGAMKSNIFSNLFDVERFLLDMEVFNNVEPIGSIRDLEMKGELDKYKSHRRSTSGEKKLVNIICYCLNPNHYHFILEQLVEGGISEFMRRLGGYTKYYNEKYKKSGVLFQGRFKAVHIESNEQLLHVSAYVNLNNKVHKKFNGTKKHFIDLISERSSWDEYIKKDFRGICKKDFILDQFKNKEDYKKMAEETIEGVKEMRYGD